MITRLNREVLLDILLRFLSCASVGFFAVNALIAFSIDKTRITLAIAVISEITTIVISLASRRPAGRDWQPLTVMATILAGSLWQPFVRFEPGFHLLNETASAAVQCLGVLWAINAKVTLGRSFGWLPANRGIVNNGVYRFVRHPIYLGFLIAHIGFLCANLSLWNATVYVFFYVAQLYRIFREEKFLMRDEAYRAYASRVRYRLIYGVF
ncbi:MAG: methyltransferase family protein [Aestuariivirga sp.]